MAVVAREGGGLQRGGAVCLPEAAARLPVPTEPGADRPGLALSLAFRKAEVCPAKSSVGASCDEDVRARAPGVRCDDPCGVGRQPEAPELAIRVRGASEAECHILARPARKVGAPVPYRAVSSAVAHEAQVERPLGRVARKARAGRRRCRRRWRRRWRGRGRPGRRWWRPWRWAWGRRTWWWGGRSGRGRQGRRAWGRRGWQGRWSWGRGRLGRIRAARHVHRGEVV